MTVSEDEIWDRERLLKRVRGKEERLHKMIDLFLADMPDRVKALQLAMDEENTEEVAAVAHAIKGVAGNLSANKVYELASEMELAGRSSDIEQQQLLMPQITQHFSKLVSVLQQNHMH